MKTFFCLMPLLAFVCCLRAQTGEPNRSPREVAVTPDGKWAITANLTSNSAALVDLDNGRVTAEAPCGLKPFGVAVSGDGATAVVTNWWGYSVTVLRLQPPRMTKVTDIPVGVEPRGVALSRDGKTAYVACGVDAAVAIVDVERKVVTNRWSAPAEPWHLALSPDEKWLIVGSQGAAQVSAIEVATGKIVRDAKLYCANVRQVAVSADSRWAYFMHTYERGFPASREDLARGWFMGHRLSRMPLFGTGPRETLSLDPSGRACGDAEAVAVSPDGERVAIPVGGTRELFLLRESLPWVPYGASGDFLDQSLFRGDGRYRSIRLGGRPISAKFTPDGNTVVVANYLDNSLQLVGAESGRVEKTISLSDGSVGGGPSEPGLARKGEAIFYDAGRTFQQWFSCHTCHAEGHTGHASFDTMNDGRFGNPKKTPSLRGVVHTAPYTWHGRLKTLEASISNSVTSTMHSPEPSAEDVQALMTFLATLDFPPNPHCAAAGSLTDAARRGEALFAQRRCVNCHTAPHFTTAQMIDVGTGSPGDLFPGYNPPSLRNAYNKAPYLHDGRAATLEELLTKHHRIDKLVSEAPLTDDELADVIAYVKSL